ncbi:MAG: kelch repeat-containing protein [Candidatus Caldarchaeum sp.]
MALRRRQVLGVAASVAAAGALYLMYSLPGPVREQRPTTGTTIATTQDTAIEISPTMTATTVVQQPHHTTQVTEKETSKTTGIKPRWLVEEPLPMALTEVAMVSDGKSLFLGGGLTAEGNASSHFFTYNVELKKWRELAPMPAALHHVGLVYLNNRVYLLGGYDDRWNAQRKAYAYRVNRDVWEELSPMHVARGALTAQAVKDVLYVVGGARDNLPLNINEAYDPASNEWKPMAPMSVAREHLTSAAVDGKIYAIGGRVVSANTMTNLDVVEEYNVEKNVWRFRKPMPTARSGLAAAVVGGLIYVCGGESQVKTFGEVEAYDPVSDTWLKVAELMTPRHGLGVAAAGDKIYTVAGGPRPGLYVSDVNEVLVLG